MTHENLSLLTKRDRTSHKKKEIFLRNVVMCFLKNGSVLKFELQCSRKKPKLYLPVSRPSFLDNVMIIIFSLKHLFHILFGKITEMDSPSEKK